MSDISPSHDPQAETNRFMQQVYGWMAFALLISGSIAYYVSVNPTLYDYIYTKKLFLPLLILEVVLVLGLTWLVQRISAMVAILVFILYSITTGLTLSIVFLIYQLGSVVSIFGVTAGIFAVMSIYGYITKKNLTGVGVLAKFGLIGIIVTGIMNIFLLSSMIHTIVSIIGVIVFITLTAYDTQKIKEMNIIGNEGTEADTKEAVMGALTLYLDFINLFLKLLSLFGKRK
ncbi:Bax inhibitor-1/YccA family protein [Candidatus Gracilibacteria bacterium]|nr:Bax inhibitor-1/YccA family protein [Candidatus Gracilibacteria bacterium]